MLKKVEYKATTSSKQPLSWKDDTVSVAEFSTDAEEMSVREKSQSYLSLLEDSIADWRFVTTKVGRCGIAPANVEVGDVVALFGGGNVPFIVRPGPEREGAFRLVGECYVDGIMRGECVGEANRVFLRLY